MNRAVIVLLLLIANAIVSGRNSNRPAAPARAIDCSLGQYATANVQPLERERNVIAPFAFDQICL